MQHTKHLALAFAIATPLLAAFALRQPENTATQTPSSQRMSSYYRYDSGVPPLLIQYEQTIPGMIWNDPSVMLDGGVYRMWLSGGQLTAGGEGVKIYSASSTDGLGWNISATPVLVPGAQAEWDGRGTETPSVVKVKDTYHMYYTGANYVDSVQGRFSIGHATSQDGVTWQKDSINPAIPRTHGGEGPGEGQPNAWGWLSVSEPGVVYSKNEKRFYLYFVASKLRFDDYSGAEPKIQTAIMLATSYDGKAFDVEPNPVLLQSATYPHDQGYYGYSTPAAYIDREGLFHLFVDVAKYESPANSFEQVSLVHATSKNGRNFVERDTDILVSGAGEWMDAEVRAPAVLEMSANTIRLYFAGGWTAGGIGVLGARH